MKIEIREQPVKAVLYWLSQDEANDESLMSSLRLQFAKWKAKKYLPVVMESGDGNIEESMYCLMKHNLEVMARNDKNDEVQEQGMIM